MLKKVAGSVLNRYAINRSLHMVRTEYTVMPRFGFHQPLDYHMDTFPPDFDSPVKVEGDLLPLPPVKERMGYAADNAEYLAWGRYDHDLVMKQIERHYDLRDGLRILDFGCSSGRVLRHFYKENRERNWKLFGVDIQARPIEWMRQNFPKEFCIYTGTVLPKLPFEDNSLDVIFGFSIFTHTKYLWDMWLLELRRALKPGGLLIQTFHSENAWDFYYKNQHESWVRENHSAHMLEHAQMPYDFFYYGDISVSQVFWKQETARTYWGRYFDVLDLTPPPEKYSFQDWIICRKSPE
jgi:SAM-dependent methyltransferase